MSNVRENTTVFEKECHYFKIQGKNRYVEQNLTSVDQIWSIYGLFLSPRKLTLIKMSMLIVFLLVGHQVSCISKYIRWSLVPSITKF